MPSAWIPEHMLSQGTTQSLHRYQASGENLSRFIGNVSESGVFVWFSGDTALVDNGSIMVYHIEGAIQSGWYASFRRSKDWRLHKVKGLSRAELTSMLEREVDEHVVEPG